MNKVILMGRLTADPEMRTTQKGTSVANFTLAVDRFGGGDDKQADFIRCIVWDKSADALCKYIEKGRRISLVGRIQTGSYENKNGDTVYTTDVIVENWYFADDKKKEANDDEEFDRPARKETKKEEPKKTSKTRGKAPWQEI